MGKYGYFSDDNMEYVVTTPHPPRDWYNFLWNPTYLACASQNMNGCSLYQDEAGAVTNLFGRQDERESPRWIYMRDRDEGKYWSAGYRPCWTEHEEYECRHGLGYSILRSVCSDIEIVFRVVVPRHHAGELWTVTVTNRSRRIRNLSMFTVADIQLDGVNMPYGYLGGLTGQFIEEENFLYYRNSARAVVDKKYCAFMYSDRKIHRWDASKDHLLGRFRDFNRPERIEDGRLGNSVASSEHLVGALQHNFRLKPGASRTTNIVLGVTRDLAEAKSMKQAFVSGDKVEKELAAVKRQAIDRLGDLRIDTPDEHFNRLFNVWLKHQLHLMADWARFYFKGYRDTCQDAAGMSVIDPERAMGMLRMALQHQRSDGFCPRAFRVASKNIAEADKHYADSPSWISHATDAILSETGDRSYLDEGVSYSDEGEGTIWEHNVRAMEFLWNDRGEHGLSLIHHGDWNDLMDQVGIDGRGESVWMSCATARVLLLVGRMAEWRGDRKVANICRRRYRILAENIRKHGWDSKLFLYAINDDGMPIGSDDAKEGRMFINPQSWAMLSGVIEQETYTRIALGMEPEVDTPVGPVHSWPPFTRYHPGIGQLTGTPPGFCTNGNVYCHAAGFKIAADYEAGRPDKAFDTFMRILPSEEKSEPYAQANGYVGPTALRVENGVSDDPWRTGTVAWHFLNGIDRLLGFRRTPEGFHLRPLLPSKWKQVRYERPFRGTVFKIEIRLGREAGITLDDQPVDGDFIPVPPGGLGRKKVTIVCVMPRRKLAVTA